MKVQFPKVELTRDFHSTGRIAAPCSTLSKPEAFSQFILWFEGPLSPLWASKCPALRKIFPPKHKPLDPHWESPFSVWEVQPYYLSTTASPSPMLFGRKNNTHLQKNLWIWPQWGLPFSKMSNEKIWRYKKSAEAISVPPAAYPDMLHITKIRVLQLLFHWKAQTMTDSSPRVTWDSTLAACGSRACFAPSFGNIGFYRFK